MTEWLIGGYTADAGGSAIGIGRGRSHPDGRFEYLGVVAETDSPSWLHVEGGTVFAALEIAGELGSFDLTTGVPLSRVAAGGALPCHLAIDRGALIAACYGDGAVSVRGIGVAGGLSPAAQVIPGSGSGPRQAQQGPHAHSVLSLGDGRVLSVDLGADLLHVHEWRDDGLVRVDSVAFPPGTGPRDLRQLPDGRLAVLSEWSCELILLEPAGDAFEIVQILALPGATDGVDQCAGLVISDDARYLYAGIRGSNRVAAVALDDAVRPVGWVSSGGNTPRHLAVDGQFLQVANQLSSTVASFRLGHDGMPEQLGEPVAVPSPTCLVALP